jgi:N-acetylglutamate synthase-like GNAT family acetyltransferase
LLDKNQYPRAKGNLSPPFFQIRPAQASDQIAIRTLIREVGINPLGLDWRRFYLAVDSDDQVVGCGQIKVHSDGSRELASIAVKENWRLQGVATRIIATLLDEEEGNIWLMCQSELVPFYEKFGFTEVLTLEDLPPYFRRVVRLWKVITRVSGGRHQGSVMVLKQ